MKLLLVLFAIALIKPMAAQAVCPICTVAVAGGLGVSRWLGIDDAITGVWIGGLILSSGFWLSAWIDKKGWRLPFKNVISVALFFLLVIPPLYWGQMIGLPGNSLWGIDKVFLGIIIGTISFLIGMWLDKFLREINEGQVFVYFQKVILPVSLLTLVSFFFYLITN